MKEEEADSSQAGYCEKDHRKLRAATPRPASGFVDERVKPRPIDSGYE